MAVGAVTSVSLAWHVVWAVHTRFVVAVPAADSYWTEVHAVAWAVQLVAAAAL